MFRNKMNPVLVQKGSSPKHQRDKRTNSEFPHNVSMLRPQPHCWAFSNQNTHAGFILIPWIKTQSPANTCIYTHASHWFLQILNKEKQAQEHNFHPSPTSPTSWAPYTLGIYSGRKTKRKKMFLHAPNQPHCPRHPIGKLLSTAP